MKLTDVIRRPLITEKTTIQREDGRTIVFQVAADATKVEVKQAIEKLLGVEGGERADHARAREGEAAGAFRRAPLRLEEGVRAAA